MDFGYFRRIWKNFQVTDDLSVTPADFTQFSMVVPTDARLDTSGQTITGLFNRNPATFGLNSDLNTLSDKYGKQIEHWNGFDLTLNARLQNGLTMQAGVSSGKTIHDNCETVAALPEMNDLGMRFGKVIRAGRTRSVISLDVFNMLNSNAVITANENFAAWLRPTSILNARLAKVSLQFEF